MEITILLLAYLFGGFALSNDIVDGEHWVIQFMFILLWFPIMFTGLIVFAISEVLRK